MASRLVTPDSTPLKSSRFHLVSWVNELLLTKHLDVRQFGSGAVQCQILDCVIPGSVDLTQVRFAAQSEEDCVHNFTILQESLSNFNIPKTFPITKLIKGEFRSNLDTLRWFRAFYLANKTEDEDYNAVAARKGQDIAPLELKITCPETDLDSDVNGLGKRLYNKQWQEEFSWAEKSPLGRKYTFCRICQKNIRSSNGAVELKRHHDCQGHVKKTQMNPRHLEIPVAQDQVMNGKAAPKQDLEQANQDQPMCSDLGFKFMRKHSLCVVADHTASMGDHTPYCLYLYDGEKLGLDLEVSVLLVGFFDLTKSRRCIRFLDAIASPTNGAAVVETLDKFHLSLDKLAALFLSGSLNASSIRSHLQGINPNIKVSGRLSGLASVTCDAGLKTVSVPVSQLIEDLRAFHCSTSDQVQPLESVFGSKISDEASVSGLNIHLLITGILEVWADLLLYFNACKDPKVQHIKSQLQNPEIEATFIFLDEALKPLHKVQESISEELPRVYRSISDLLSTLTSRFPHSKPGLCGSAVEAFLKKSKASDLLPLLRERALAFYRATTSRILEELPLSAGLLKSGADLLDPRTWLKVTGEQVKDLGTNLGIGTSPEDVLKLTGEFEDLKKDQESTEEPASLERHWTSVLMKIKSTSLFRRLLLTLLCFPCPPLDTSLVFTQALRQTDSPKTSSTNGKATEELYVRTNDGLLTPREVAMCCRVQLNKLDESLDVIEGIKVSWKMGRRTPARRKKHPGRPKKEPYPDGLGFRVGELVWGKLKGFSWWPGLVNPWKTKTSPPGIRNVEWFGDGMFSEIYTEKLLPFRNFTMCFCKNSYASLPMYKDAIYQVLELAGERSGKSFPEAKSDREEELKLMMDWAVQGFLPKGPSAFLSIGGYSSNTESPESSLSDSQPPAKRKYTFKTKAMSAGNRYCRELIREKLKDGFNIENLCLACGSTDVVKPHPMFEGGLCARCKDNFTETFFRYDEDGYQSYCAICCGGLEVLLCDNASCCRCFCKDCLEILLEPGTFDKITNMDPWSCFICKPEDCKQDLRLRSDWSVKVQDFFANDSAFEFEPHRLYPSIPADQRRPLKVLSLFDGIATGYLVLRDLGFNIERYIASEICDDSIAVGMIKHEGKIEYVNDVRTITRKHLAEWGPFDLLIGGSPCNDLSMVNPLRKGLFEGTGRLFFEFYRILTLLKPKEDEERPFFWLFENVVFMSAHDKSDICRFLECNPILIDAIKVSPANRARYFWGNLPGMKRPLASSLDDKVTLQDCLEIGRVAKFDKVRTITTKSNSIRQGKSGPLPVSMNGREDYLWCTEMEQVFGFPKHYTDVNNMGRAQRQKVLGRSWSVPVIRHLFAPLKDYFQCQS